MQTDKELLGRAPLGKLLLKLAVPTVIAQLVNMLYNIVDRIYIGHMEGVGDLALTGVGVAMPIIMVVSAFAALVGSGGAPRASILLGKKDGEGAESILGSCFTLQVLLSAVLTVVLLIWHRPMLLAFGASESTVGFAADYLSVYALGTVFVQITLGMNSFITAQGYTRVSMVSVVIGATTNIILDPILIYGFSMGIKGAALATVISQALSAVWIITFLCGKKTILRLSFSKLSLSPSVLLPCLALGSATFIMQASESVIFILFNSSLQRYGGDIAVGAMTILSSVMQLAMLPLQGIAQGAQPILSYNYGARNARRVKKTFMLLLFTCLSYSAVFAASVMLFPRAFVAIFTSNTELLAFASRVIRIYFGGTLIFGIQIACQMTFVSLGSALSSVLVAVVRKFVLLLPLILIMPHLMENALLGVYLAEPIADVLAVTFTSVLFTFRFKKALRSIEGEAI